MKIKWRILISCLLIVYFVAFLGSLFTSHKVDSDWYLSLRTSLTPPNFVFPIVWNILFFMVGISLYLVWINSSRKEKKKVGIVFGINLFLNVFWSFLFFGLQNPLFAFFELIILWASIVSIIFVCWGIEKRSSYLLIPYLLWVSFAGILNLMIAFS